ncbi:LacI family DNA-binding transcriptional regulator [Kutzneria sp. 744]|uniref:LacI family DNA-binding transcriptional regulator n=1 Tax=Kutzneria sp. (strain 744) TaxID=345341 RepID=UPI0003EEAFE3|nr:LacI-family transcriptional regulator [Kutzneria sp. 744]
MVAPDRQPTLADVARWAGVSVATASRVLNRSAPVNGDTAARVERAVAELGYVRQRSPHLVRGHSGAVSVVVFDDMLRYQEDGTTDHGSFFQAIAQGLVNTRPSSCDIAQMRTFMSPSKK